MYSGGQWISPGNRTQSRQCPVNGRQQSCLRYGQWAGNHRSLRAGHAFRGVTRELGRASRLLGSKSRSKGNRQNQYPGDHGQTPPMNEPTLAQVRRDTNQGATQGTAREPKANRPGRTKAVVATHSTAERRATSARTRGEPRPKEPTITLERTRKGNAGHDICIRERQEGHRAHNLPTRNWYRLRESPVAAVLRAGRAATVMRLWSRKLQVLGPKGPLLTNRMTESVTYGSVGGVGRKPGPYPAGLSFAVRRSYTL
jgi:hypothetical protein